MNTSTQLIIVEKIAKLENKLMMLEQEKSALEQEVHVQAKTARQFRRLMMFVSSSILAMALVVGASGYLMAQSVPLTYSGYLEKDGKPLNGKYKVEYALYSSEVATTALPCGTSKPDVIFVKGRFKVPLDATCISVIQSNREVWIQLAVDSTSISRQRLSASPYAVSSGPLLGMAYGQWKTGHVYTPGALSSDPKAWSWTPRIVTYRKKINASLLKITYYDGFLVTPNNMFNTRAGCIFGVFIDGKPCNNNVVPLEAYLYTSGAFSSNVFRANTISGICKDVRAGTHTVQVYVINAPGFPGGAIRCEIGKNHSSLMVEELAP